MSTSITKIQVSVGRVSCLFNFSFFSCSSIPLPSALCTDEHNFKCVMEISVTNQLNFNTISAVVET